MERSNSVMMKKRGLDSNDSEEGDSNKKRPALASVIVESFKVDSLQQLRSSLVSMIRTELHSSLVPIIRTVVSEEVQHALSKLGPGLSGRSSPKRNEGPDGRNLQLHFSSRLSLPLFTDGKVEGEQGAAVSIVLVDQNSGLIVTSGPESSAKLDVVVLEGDFNNEDWTREKFESHVVKERKGKRPLLTGDLQVTLKEGVGTLGDLTFTDNSSWIPCKKFRLGLTVASGDCESLCIREAKTDAFTVKDRRGELYKKHYPPALNDEVWRLEKIGKDGPFHKGLNKAGIRTVEDFLRLVNSDSEILRNILGSSMSNKKWDTLIKHAKTCLLSGKLYVFYADDTKVDGVVFNNSYKLSGLIAGGQYYPADSISESHQVYANTLVQKAYDNLTHVIEYDGKELISFEQNKQPSASLSVVPLSQQDCPTSIDQQWSLPSLPVQVPPLQPSVDSGLIVGGYNDDSSNLSLYSNGFLTEEETHMRDHEILESEYMQHLHPTVSMDNHNSVNPTEDVLHYSSCVPFPSTNYSWDMEDHNPFLTINYNWHEEDHNPFPTTNYSYKKEVHDRSSGKAIVGWLKLKAALSWGIFVRRKQSEIRAQLVQLDD
ncbi:Calmodulin binding protein-like [Macleaya cordata]|uniref:Calmodulin binding protein-like n=1 Tax=Macleaya cordata TaxID=56857 RepID=A0A200RE18_MACCD|nr:Calmodulin binding protein-like [Macleaya cordata]